MAACGSGAQFSFPPETPSLTNNTHIIWIPGCLPDYPIFRVLEFWGSRGVRVDMQMKRLGARILMKRMRMGIGRNYHTLKLGELG